VAPSVPAVTKSVAPESGPVIPMAPVVIESSRPPPAKVVEAAPVLASTPAVEVAMPIAPSAPAFVIEAPVSLVEGTRAPVVEAAIATADAVPVVEAALPIAPAAPAPVIEAPVSLVEGTRAPVVEAAIPSAAAAPAAGFELNFESAPVPATAPVGSNPTSAERGSRPRIVLEARRRAGEDLIGELFEIMHELNFAHDVAEGSEFVLSVLNELLPCEGVLIHVFDINTGHFVVVRAKGPNANTVLLQRMSDQDPLVRSVMRSTHATSVEDATDDPRFSGSRWQALGVAPRSVLCGGVQLSGRYLGLIEIANPHGGVPFHQSELNALDYICEQFAAFLSKKPIVLSADVVLSRG